MVTRTNIQNLLFLIVAIVAVPRQVWSRTYGLKNSLIQSEGNRDFDFGDGVTLIDDEDMQSDQDYGTSSGDDGIVDFEGSGITETLKITHRYPVRLMILSNDAFRPNLRNATEQELHYYKGEVKHYISSLFYDANFVSDVDVTELREIDHGKILASFSLLLYGSASQQTVFNKLFMAVQSGQVGNLRVSSEGFSFKQPGDSCPSSLTKEINDLPHVGDAKASLLIGQPFVCFGWLKSIQYFRGDPYAEAFLGLWHNLSETSFTLRNKLKLLPASLGVHTVTIPDQWLVNKGDYLGIHYPRDSQTGAVTYSKPSDNILSQNEFYQTVILPIHDDEIFPNSPVVVDLGDLQFEPRAFSLNGLYTSDYIYEEEGVCSAEEFECVESKICIAIARRCNGYRDCSDMSDELDCDEVVIHPIRPCGNYEFRCLDGTCIPSEQRCDNNYQCPDGSDEQDCGRCPKDSFHCGYGECIFLIRRCDGIRDCPDFSDEADCAGTCSASDFVCRDNRQCVPLSRRCDSRYDCLDGSDEEGCDVPTPPSFACRSDEFNCSSGYCIPRYLLCNGEYDCPDRSDEQACPTPPPACAADHFQCQNGRCIPSYYRCNGNPDCEDGSDEQFCPTPGCASHEFQCRDGTCIDARFRCNSYTECPDRSDEEGCSPVTCREDEFDCQDGRCIPDYLRCNGRNECSNGLDEQSCPTKGCSSDEFECEDGSCIQISYRCNGRIECPYGIDEQFCPTQPSCSSSEFQCTDGRCVPISYRCDGRNDCSDGLDEQFCPTSPTCSSNEFQCQDGRCIPASYRCDGRSECADGSDEQFCPTPAGCAPNEFQCLDGRCIPNYYRCDGRQDCQDGSDEYSCQPPTPPACNENFQFRCWDGSCIDKSRQCDKRNDCFDASDEQQCEVTASPSELILRIGASASFVCRAKSQSSIRWFRRDRLPLPSNAVQDSTGRLTVIDVKPQDSGEYVCSDERGIYDASVLLTVQDIVGPTLLPPPKPGYCKAEQSMCNNGECIPVDYVCDGDFDCSDKSDEHDCLMSHTCEPNEFRCSNSKCILQIWRCDGDNDCGENDKSDEIGCDTSITQTGCRADEFKCTDIHQCIPAGYHCDNQADCQDQSDEKGCISPSVPVRMVEEKAGHQGEEIVLVCEARGNPAPLIIWRLNWGFVGAAPRVTSTVERVTPLGYSDGLITVKGTLVIRDLRKEDEGAYSCEAINSRGSIFATPDTIVYLLPPREIFCQSPYFNVEARSRNECLRCWCSGLSDVCTSSNLYNSLRKRDYDIRHASLDLPVAYFPLDVNQQSFAELFQPFLGNRITSYGGFIIYNVLYHGKPDVRQDLVAVILTGANGVKLYSFHEEVPQPNITTRVHIPIREHHWYLDDRKLRPSSRNDLLEVLKDITSAQVRYTFVRGQSDSSISDIYLSITSEQDNSRGKAYLVEECSCPPGYAGTSCEQCAPYYVKDSLGKCVAGCSCNGHSNQCDSSGYCLNCQDNTSGKNCEKCASGYYGDATRGARDDCKMCPCPVQNNKATPCWLTVNNEVQCENCPSGSYGQYCNLCHDGHIFVEGICTKPSSTNCFENGTAQKVDDTCQCKGNVEGPTCYKCKKNAFNLRGDNPLGCDVCYCSGVSTECQLAESYTWDSIHSRFGNTGIPALDNDNFVIWEDRGNEKVDYEVNTRVRPGYITFPTPDFKQYNYIAWELPDKYLGNKLTSYGGYLNYTVYYASNTDVPTNWPDVEIRGSNGVVLQYRIPKSNFRPPQKISIPFRENDWTRASTNRPSSREEFMSVLSKVIFIGIRAQYTTHDVENSLADVSLDIATQSNGGRPKAEFLEQCNCPNGYTGLSCESCADGYIARPEGELKNQCIKCDCHGHGDCDYSTMTCINCEDNTEGDYCERCSPGFYGDATKRGPDACRPCLCPREADDGRSISRCEEDKLTGTLRCLTCPIGHTGERCERCLQGYTGNPIERGGYCRPTSMPVSPVIMKVEDQTPDRGHDVILRCDVSGRDPIVSQWVRGENQPLSSRAYEQEDRSLLIRDIQPEDSGVYVCIARNAFGSTNISVSVYVTGVPEVHIEMIPSTYEPASGERYNLTCSVRNAPRYDLRWSRENLPLSSRTLRVENTLFFTPITESDAGVYVCTVTANGRVYVEYYTVRVRANNLPEVASNATAVTANVNQDVTLYCKVQSDYPATVYWTKQGSSDLGPRSTVDRDNTLHIRGIQSEDSGVYICTAQNVYGRKDHYITLTVKDLVIVDFKNVYRANQGDNVNLACQVRDPSRYLISWVRNDREPLGPRAHMDDDKVLHIRGIQPEDGGNYTCIVRSFLGDEYRSVAYIQVVPVGLEPTIVPGPSYIPIPVGSDATLSCVAQSQFPYTVYWFKDGTDITAGKQDDNSIVLRNFQQVDEAVYTCRVVNQYGQVEHRVNVTAIVPNGNGFPRVHIQPEYWREGDSLYARLHCFVRGERGRVVWSRADGRGISGKVRYEAENILVIPQVTADDAGDYVCSVYNRYGTAQSSIYLRREDPRAKFVELIGKRVSYVKAGDTATFVCSVNAEFDDAPAPIIWFRKDRKALDHRYSDDGEGQLIIHDVNPSDAGKIVCQAFSLDGQDEDEVELIIEDDSSPDRMPSAIIGSPYETVAKEGEAVEIMCFVKGNPKPSIYWTHNGLPLYQFLTQDGNVYIPQVKQEDEGEYVCHARNQVGTASSRIFLNIQNPKYPVSVSAPTKIIENRDLTLSCRTDSYIKVEGIDWEKFKGRLPPGSQQIKDEFGSSLKIPECRKEDEGRYLCTIYFVDGEKEMAYYTFKLAHDDGIVVSPGIYLEVFPKSANVVAGSTVTLTCSVHNAGQSIPAISWSRLNQPLPRSHRIDGPTLTIYNIAADEGGSYLCSANTDDGYKEVHSEVVVQSANIDVKAILLVNAYETLEVEEGHPLNLECTHLRFDSYPGDSIWWSHLRGETPLSTTGRAVYSVGAVDRSYEGRYTCRLHGELGDFERHVDVKVIQRDAGEHSDISIYPPSLRIAVGQSSQLQCVAHGRDFQWFIQFGDTEDGWLPVGHIKNAEAIGNVLRFTDLTQSNSGYYKCVTLVEIEGRYQEVEATAHIEVLSPPVISIDPSSIHLRPGEHLRLECRAEGSPPILFQWSRDSLVPLPPRAFERHGILEIPTVMESDAGKYFCSARNDIGTAENVAEVIVFSTPTAIASPRMVVREVGSTAEFRCQASGSPPPQVKWSKEIGSLPEQHSITTDSLILYNVQPQDKGNYICSAFNEAGQSRDVVFLEVTGASGGNPGHEIPTKFEQARIGDSVEINCEPSTYSPNINWLKEGGALPPKVVVDGSILLIPSVEESDEGTYRCYANHENGIYSAQVILTVLLPPMVSEQYSRKIVSVGGNAQLVCEARGNPRPRFSWYKRNGELPRNAQVSDNVLWIPEISKEDFGEYICQAQNEHGVAEIVFELESGHFIPYFIQNPLSYLTLPVVRRDVKSLSFTFNVKSLSNEGLILLYSGLNPNEGFISLGQVEGQTQAHFYDGRQLHTVRGRAPNEDEWSEIEFKIDQLGASLRVDFDTEVSVGNYEVRPHYSAQLYLGGAPQSLLEATYIFTKIRDGFNGCINKLSIDGEVVDIDSQMTHSHDVKDCPVCSHDHCRNGGSCYPANNQKGFSCRCLHGFSGFYCDISAKVCSEGSCGARGQCINQQCVCPLGLSGDDCSVGRENTSPYFSGKSFLALPLYSARPNHFNLSLNLMAAYGSQKSIIFYLADHQDGSGDFVSLYYTPESDESGFVTLSYKTDKDRLSDEQHQDQINLNGNLYVGGVDESFSYLCCELDHGSFFSGRIYEVRMNESPFDLLLYPVHYSLIEFRNGENRFHSTCSVHCLNGGTCFKTYAGLDRCHCLLGYAGELCETRIVLRQSVEFNSEGFLEFSTAEFHDRQLKFVEFNLITTQRYGLVFWQSSRDFSTHISLGLEDGKIVMKNMIYGRSFDLSSSAVVADGLKHHVQVTWGDGFVRLTIDGYDIVEKEMQFNIQDPGSFFLGGLEDLNETRGLYSEGFDGCISDLSFEGDDRDLHGSISLSRLAIAGRNAHVCSIDESF